MSKSTSRTGVALELLAPAGNWECARAAVENGADAIYFGLQVGFNARARADNFTLDDLPSTMERLHERGVLGYVTLNTLVFTDELDEFERNVAALAKAGVDAVLVQDIGAARLIREVCPDLPIHASTQMTMVSAESIAALDGLGVQRVVLARELSINEISKISQATAMPLECFVHGALCVAYSGQCLTSESLGGRSANRGQCAQACRLDYKLHVHSIDRNDSVPEHRRTRQYFLSPQDLAGFDQIPALIEAGVTSFKIEGRLKSPEYVANTVRHYRRAIDEAAQGRSVSLDAESKRELEMSFSRGFSPGWLEGCNHKRLVPGNSSAKRGVEVGRVVALRGERVTVELNVPIAKGYGIVFEGDRAAGREIGGRIYEVIVKGRSVNEPTAGRVEWLFERGLLKQAELHAGQRIWLTDDPRLTKKLRASFSASVPQRLRPVDLEIEARVGERIRVVATMDEHRLELFSDEPLIEAEKHAVDERMLREQLGRLGGTPFVLGDVHATLAGRPMIPFSRLGTIRRSLVEGLTQLAHAIPVRDVRSHGVAKAMLARVKQFSPPAESSEVKLRVLCRSLSQMQSVIEEGCREVYVDFHDIRQYKLAVAEAKKASVSIFLTTLRIQKPGELGLFHAIAKQGADGWLIRNLAALCYAREHGIPTVGDFSLNVTNPLTAEWLMSQGLRRVTASYDLNRDQLSELIADVPPSWLEVVVHQHIPMFHMEHCVFCTELSPGTDKSNCGRPCDRLAVQLEDRIGVKHVLHADVGCRNTLYNGTAQSGAEAVPGLLQRGIRNFRVELLNDTPTGEVKKLLGLYRDLLDGKVGGTDVWKSLKADNRVGVTRGTMEQPRNPLAIV
jgi:putative protease